MNCTFCNATLPPGAIYCPECGTNAAAEDARDDSWGPMGKNPYAAPRSSLRAPEPIYAPDLPTTSALAITSLVCGCVGWPLGVGCWPIGLICSIVTIITGHMAHQEIRAGAGMRTGRGLATAGLIQGYVQLAFAALVIGTVVVLILTRGLR